MAQGKIDNDAGPALATAGDGKNEPGNHWPAGTNSGNNDNTRALPALWQNFDDVIKMSGDLVAAATEMDANRRKRA